MVAVNQICRVNYSEEYIKTIPKEIIRIQQELASRYPIITHQNNLKEFKNITLTRYHIHRIKEIAEIVEGATLRLERELIEGEE